MDKEYVLLKEYPFRKIGDKLYIDAYCLLSFKDDQETFAYCGVFDNPIPDLLEQGWIKEIQKPLEVWSNVYINSNGLYYTTGGYLSKEEAFRVRGKRSYIRTSKFREVINEEIK